MMPVADPLCSDPSPDLIAQRIILAYVQLAVAPKNAASRTVVIARHGGIEVRLTEVLVDAKPGLPPFWLEIHSYASGATIDSFGCHEFDEDELDAAVAFVRGARQRLRTLH
jgi:hypothetical protein